MHHQAPIISGDTQTSNQHTSLVHEEDAERSVFALNVESNSVLLTSVPSADCRQSDTNISRQSRGNDKQLANQSELSKVCEDASNVRVKTNSIQSCADYILIGDKPYDNDCDISRVISWMNDKLQRKIVSNSKKGDAVDCKLDHLTVCSENEYIERIDITPDIVVNSFRDNVRYIGPRNCNITEFESISNKAQSNSLPSKDLGRRKHSTAAEEGVPNRKRIRIHVCSHCKETFKQSAAMIDHMRQVHNDKRPFKCAHCSRDFGTTMGLMLHKRKHTGERPYACTQCDKSFIQSAHIQSHIKLVHFRERPYACTQCTKTFPLLSVLKDHEGTHRGDRPFVCDECGQAFTRAQHLNVHKRIHSGEQPYACNQCDMTFHQAAHLNQHTNLIHSDERTHMCIKCGRLFASISQLKGHETLHCGNRRLSTVRKNSDIAGTFVSRLDMGSSKIRTKKLRYNCEECDSTFTQFSSLKRHQLTHNNLSLYECVECNKSYQQPFNLKKHVRRHHSSAYVNIETAVRVKTTKTSKWLKAGNTTQVNVEIMSIVPPPLYAGLMTERPYACTECDKTYAKSISLKLHIKHKHRGERKFACSMCDKRFTQSGDLKRHIVSHTGEKPYGCADCDKRFSYPGGLKAHKLLHELQNRNNVLYALRCQSE